MALLVVVAAGFGIRWLAASRTPKPPQLPAGVTDTAVVEAIEAARSRVLEEPGSGLAWGELGLDFRSHGFMDESNICFEEAARLDPDNPKWPYLTGLAWIETKPDEAVKFLEQANRLAKVPADRSATRMRLAEFYLDHGRADEAAALFEAELRADAESARAHYALAGMALGRNDPKSAVEHLKHVERSPYGRKNAAALLAVAYGRLNQPEDAARYAAAAAGMIEKMYWPDPFVQAYVTRGRGRTALVERAEALYVAGRQSEGLEILEQMAQQYPDVQTLSILGEALARQGAWEQAERAYQRAIECDASAADPRARLGAVRFQRGELLRETKQAEAARAQYEAARTALLKAVELKPGHTSAHLELARVHRRLGDLRAAEESCRDSLRANPAGPDAHLMLGEVLLELNRPAEAIEPLEQAVRLSANAATARTLLDKAREAAAKP